jgi:hypothetical protein
MEDGTIADDRRLGSIGLFEFVDESFEDALFAV